MLTAADWRTIESGVRQRVHAINRFLDDVYHDQKILADGVVPADLVFGTPTTGSRWSGSICRCGIDIVRDRNGDFLVLEDNASTPSGVS